MDYRELNKVKIFNKYSITVVEEFMRYSIKFCSEMDRRMTQTLREVQIQPDLREGPI